MGTFSSEPSSTEPDWQREAKRFFEWNPGKSLLSSIRAYQRSAAKTDPINSLRRRVAVLRHRFWSVITGADIPLNCRVGGGLLIPHPNGIVIHSAAEIGPNCLIFQQVTLGWSGTGVPRVGGNVNIGAGAKIIGAVTLGDRVRIGANAVVTRDVPSDALAFGVPARARTPNGANLTQQV